MYGRLGEHCCMCICTTTNPVPFKPRHQDHVGYPYAQRGPIGKTSPCQLPCESGQKWLWGAHPLGTTARPDGPPPRPATRQQGTEPGQSGACRDDGLPHRERIRSHADYAGKWDLGFKTKSPWLQHWYYCFTKYLKRQDFKHLYIVFLSNLQAFVQRQ